MVSAGDTIEDAGCCMLWLSLPLRRGYAQGGAVERVQDGAYV